MDISLDLRPYKQKAWCSDKKALVVQSVRTSPDSVPYTGAGKVGGSSPPESYKYTHVKFFFACALILYSTADKVI